MPRALKPALFAACIVAFAMFPLFRPPAFFESFLYLVFLWVALATSWTILSGFSGYFSFGHGAFYGAGIYTTATLAGKFDWPVMLTWVAAGIVAALLGLVIGAIVFRLRRMRGEVFALLTLAVTFVLATIVLNTKIDGGPGIFLSGVTLPHIYNSPNSTLYLFGLVIAALSMAAAWIVQQAPLGRALFAIHDDEDVAETMGVPTYRYKLMALALSCFLAGVAGGIHAIFITYVTVAETFSITVPLFVILMSVLGGARHWLGPAIGAAFVTTLTYAFVGGDWAVAGRAIIGLVLILVILFLPHGVMGFVTQRFTRAPKDAIVIPPASTCMGPKMATPAGDVLLRCADVHKYFRGVRALSGVTLDIRAGEILGIVGPNGSGKSTLVNVISGFLKPTAGRIVFAGHDLAGAEGHRIARIGIARTYQIPRPFRRLSVLENVRLAAMFGGGDLSPGDADRDARQWLSFVGLAERAHALPTQLNLHQRKFLELARALASRPRLVLLDEVLSGLTPTEIESAVAMIRRIRAQGATVIFIEHNMRAVLELSDRLVVLNFGQVIAQGVPREVMREPEVVSAYLGSATHA
jgi:branched-chain amino acid transport system permease protein